MAKSKVQELHEDLNPYKYDFSHEEIEEMGKTLAVLVEKKKDVEAAKAVIAATYGKQVKEIQEELAALAKKIRDGHEMREPEQGQIVFRDGSSPEEGLTEADAERLAGDAVDTEATEVK